MDYFLIFLVILQYKLFAWECRPPLPQPGRRIPVFLFREVVDNLLVGEIKFGVGAGYDVIVASGYEVTVYG